MPSLQDGVEIAMGAFPGFHPGLFSFAPSGSGVCEGMDAHIPTDSPGNTLRTDHGKVEGFAVSL